VFEPDVMGPSAWRDTSYVTRVRIDSAWSRWGFAVTITFLALGTYATAAGTYELLSNRHLKPGWTRYQPPWTVPVLVIGIALVLTSVAILTARYVASKRRESEAAAT
jgi:hypothetical protein